MLIKPMSFMKAQTGGGGGTFVSATFDGSSAYVSTSSAFGSSSAGNFTGALIMTSSATTTGYVATSGNIRTYVQLFSNGDFYIKAKNSTNTFVFEYFHDASVDGVDWGDGNEKQLVWKYDGSSGASQVYYNDNGGGWTDDSTNIDTSTSSETVDLSNTTWAVGARSTPNTYYDGSLKMIRIWDDQNPDLSSASVRDNMLAFSQGLGTTPLLNLGFATLAEWNTTDINLGDSAAQFDMNGTVT